MPDFIWKVGVNRSCIKPVLYLSFKSDSDWLNSNLSVFRFYTYKYNLNICLNVFIQNLFWLFFNCCLVFVVYYSHFKCFSHWVKTLATYNKSAKHFRNNRGVWHWGEDFTRVPDWSLLTWNVQQILAGN